MGRRAPARIWRSFFVNVTYSNLSTETPRFGGIVAEWLRENIWPWQPLELWLQKVFEDEGKKPRPPPPQL